ncbi:CRP-like cAMP-binding protein [Devosia sp. UYZn731]|uniref:Crp/Fnr family transcriptional regulator n=1 Tax=Devosia sp. UYZn731 TaxID=3156345 RepID=UPI00339B7BDC
MEPQASNAFMMSPTANRLLRSLPAELVASLIPDLEFIPLVSGQALEFARAPTDFVCFVVAGIVAASVQAGSDHTSTVAIIGSEGATGAALAMGDEIAVHDTIVQMDGSAFGMPADRFLSHLDRLPTLRSMMQRYARSLWLQTMFTSACNARSGLDVRMGRILLMISDRVGPEFRVTHEHLARILCVRRPGTTSAIHLLEGLHLIRSSRGYMAVTDRAGLLDFVGDAYGRPESEYERLIGGQSASKLNHPSVEA